MVQYSYTFNVQLLGIPEVDPASSKESALETTKLCSCLFNSIGAYVALSDTDIVHRVPARNPSPNNLKPIICKFVDCLRQSHVASLGNFQSGSDCCWPRH